METVEAPALPELESHVPTLPAFPATLDVTTLTQGLLPITCELVNAIHNACVQLEGVQHETLKQFPPSSAGYAAAKHYCKGIADALIIMRRLQAAKEAFQKWERELVKVDAEAAAAAKALREERRGGAR